MSTEKIYHHPCFYNIGTHKVDNLACKDGNTQNLIKPSKQPQCVQIVQVEQGDVPHLSILHIERSGQK